MSKFEDDYLDNHSVTERLVKSGLYGWRYSASIFDTISTRTNAEYYLQGSEILFLIV